MSVNLITAQQHCFTRLELDYSAQRRSGYQTACASAGLSSAEVSDIEKRVQCFQPPDASAVRHQFFILSTGRFALSHTCEIPTNRAINDSSGRTGIFLAHTLVVTKDDLARIMCDPFCIFDPFDFVKSAEVMVERFGQATAMIDTASITPTEPPSVTATEWSAGETRKLVSLAMNAQAITNRKQSVSFIGTPEAAQRALRVVFAFSPVPDRLLCTFDTCIDRCAVTPGSVWAVGMSTRQSTTAYLEVSAKDRVVLVNHTALTATQADKNDVYVSWLDQKTGQAGTTALSPVAARTAHLIAHGIQNDVQPRIEVLDEATAREVYELQQKRMDERLHEALTRISNDSVAEAALPYLREVLSHAELTSAASGGFEPRRLANVLLAWLMQPSRPILPSKSYPGLVKLAQQTRNSRLLFLAATLGDKPDETLRDSALQTMSAEEFSSLLPFLLNPIEPEHFVSLKHVDALLAEPSLAKTSAEASVELLRRMLAAGLQDHLDALAQLVDKLDSGQLVSVEKAMQKLPSPASVGFEQTVERRRKVLGKPSRLLGIFRK